MLVSKSRYGKEGLRSRFPDAKFVSELSVISRPFDLLTLRYQVRWR